MKIQAGVRIELFELFENDKVHQSLRKCLPGGGRGSWPASRQGR